MTWSTWLPQPEYVTFWHLRQVAGWHMRFSFVGTGLGLGLRPGPGAQGWVLRRFGAIVRRCRLSDGAV